MNAAGALPKDGGLKRFAEGAYPARATVEALPDSKDSLSSRTDTQKVITMRPSIFAGFHVGDHFVDVLELHLVDVRMDLPFRSERNCFREVLPAAHDRATDGDPAQNPRR